MSICALANVANMNGGHLKWVWFGPKTTIFPQTLTIRFENDKVSIFDDSHKKILFTFFHAKFRSFFFLRFTLMRFSGIEWNYFRSNYFRLVFDLRKWKIYLLCLFHSGRFTISDRSQQRGQRSSIPGKWPPAVTLSTLGSFKSLCYNAIGWRT